MNRSNQKAQLALPIFVMLIVGLVSMTISAQDTSNAVESGASSGSAQVRHVSVQEAKEIIDNNPDIVILDVRTPVEFKLGHLDHAININYYSFSFKEKIRKLDRNKTYLVHCQTGVRSGKTLPIMKRAGFTNVLHMDKGYKDWKNRGLPISK